MKKKKFTIRIYDEAFWECEAESINEALRKFEEEGVEPEEWLEEYGSGVQYEIEYKSFPKSLNKYNKEDYERFVKSLALTIDARDYQIDTFYTL